MSQMLYLELKPRSPSNPSGFSSILTIRVFTCGRLRFESNFVRRWNWLYYIFVLIADVDARSYNDVHQQLNDKETEDLIHGKTGMN